MKQEGKKPFYKAYRLLIVVPPADLALRLALTIPAVIIIGYLVERYGTNTASVPGVTGVQR